MTPALAPVPPGDVETYLATVVLGSHLEHLPEAEHAAFTRAVAERLPSNEIDHVRLNLVAAADSNRQPKLSGMDVLVSLNHRLTWGGTTLNMADRRILGTTLADAARGAGNRWIFPELVDEGHEPWAGCRWVAYASSPEPTHAFDVTGHLDAGVRSLEAHRSYIDGLGTDFDARSFLETAARAAGAPLGVELALTFEVLNL